METKYAIVFSHVTVLSCDTIGLPHRRRLYTKSRRRIARYNVTYVDHHHGDELMLMNVHGDSSKLINAS